MDGSCKPDLRYPPELRVLKSVYTAMCGGLFVGVPVHELRSAMASLFEVAEQEHLTRALPLAARMRPRTLDEFVGQEHFLGPGKLLMRLLAAYRLGSLIFHGPPGSG